MNNTSPNPSLTASEIARALGKSDRHVRARLEGVGESELRVDGGKVARAWRLSELPVPLRDELTKKTGDASGRAAALLGSSGQPWQPEVALTEVTAECYNRAFNLRIALRDVLGRADLSRLEREALGLRDYRAVFGHAITAKSWWRIYDRTVTRDNGAKDWQRLEIYLPANPARKEPPPSPSAALPGMEDLRRIVAEVGSSPTERGKNDIWHNAFLLFEQAQPHGAGAPALKLQILQMLEGSASFLAASGEALRTAWKRNYRKWKRGGELPTALDKGKGGWRRAPELTKEDRGLLISAMAKLGGGVDQGWRARMEDGTLSEPITSYYASSVFRCPRKIRLAVASDVILEKATLHGPKSVRLNGAFVDRDPNGIASGDWDQSDDMTNVNLWWEETPEGTWFGQGQLLVWVDERSWFIYSWDLISDKSYSGFSVRNSWTAKALDWGLPRKGFYLENGTWKKSRVLVGRKDAIDPYETEQGLRRLGLRFQHAQQAKGKIIERVYGLNQDYLQALKGYVGRNPITDKYEEVQKQRSLVQAGHEHPSRFFYSKPQMMDILAQIFLKFNRTPLHGKYHGGRSPQEVYEQCFTTQLVKVSAELRHLVASNRIVTTTGRNGITFQFGKQTFNYKSHLTGERRQVVAWFNCDRPETLWCTDMNGEKPFVVPRSTKVPNHDPAPGVLEQALNENAAQNSYQRELHRTLKPYYQEGIFKNLFRPNVVAPEQVERAAEFKRQEDAIQAQERETQSTAGRARRAYSALGRPVPEEAMRRPEMTAAAQRLNELLNEDASESPQ